VSTATPAGRLADLDCSRVTPHEVAEVLSAAPAPRVVALHGSVPFVTMEPFGEFLVAMGYPADRLRNPVDGRFTYGSFVDSRRLAGEIAWHYEREGLMPMLIGHSQGGMVVIKVLHELAGRGDVPIAVWDPARGEPEARTTIVDPRSGETRPVVGLRVDFAAALVTGSLPRIVLGQWGVLPLLRDVPDSVVEFTGFAIPWDPIAGTGSEPAPYRATGTARVRNVVLPAGYSHVWLPAMSHLAAQPATREWINAWHPDAAPQVPQGVDVSNLLVAADLWHSVKRQWCVGAKANVGGVARRVMH